MRETCVPQSYAWGGEAQMDWYEAYADLVRLHPGVAEVYPVALRALRRAPFAAQSWQRMRRAHRAINVILHFLILKRMHHRVLSRFHFPDVVAPVFLLHHRRNGGVF